MKSVVRGLVWIAVFVITLIVVLLPFLPRMFQLAESGTRPEVNSAVTIVWNLSTMIFPGFVASIVATWSDFRAQPKRGQYVAFGMMSIFALVIVVGGWFIFFRG